MRWNLLLYGYNLLNKKINRIKIILVIFYFYFDIIVIYRNKWAKHELLQKRKQHMKRVNRNIIKRLEKVIQKNIKSYKKHEKNKNKNKFYFF